MLYGSATFVSAGSATMDSADVVLLGEAAGDEAGTALHVADIDADGTDDLLVGAPYYDDGAVSNAGRAYLVYGASTLSGDLDLGLQAGLTITGSKIDDQAGAALTAADMDADGLLDLAVGAP